MGNYSEIWIRSHKNNEYYEEDIVQHVNYNIPLFWLALFKPDDIIEVKEEDNNVNYYIFRASLIQCCQIFESRLNVWSTLYHDEKAEILAKSFLQYLKKLSNGIVDLNINDILGMYIDYNTIEAKNEMVKLIQIIEKFKYSSDNQDSPYLPSQFILESSKTRYLELDGFGKELIPCQEVDEYLEKKEITLNNNERKTPLYEVDYSIDEKMFYRIIVNKGDVFKFNLMNYKHRYLFLAKLKNNKIRKILLFTLLSCEILFNSTLLLLLFFTTKNIVTRSHEVFFKKLLIAFILTMIMAFLLKKIFNIVKNTIKIKPIIQKDFVR
ncbi:hypothetical protein [Acinetobacter modestus]|uniref:hypothetical protein n=1 Tax=Acinetobacter modestus TaxID=1776740 RepID=UPI00301AA09A